MVVYKAEFPNGKVYIGKSKNFESRKMRHFYDSRYNNKKSTKMKNAINKYGYENINWYILFESNDLDIINNKEKEYILIYDSIKTGYNISNGGDGGDTISNNYRKYDIIKQQYKSKGLDPDNYIIITEELKIEIIKDYIENKLSIKALKRKYNISNQRLTRLLKSEKVEIDKNKSSETNTKTFDNLYIEKIISLYKDGKTIKIISELENKTIMIISRILHDSGVRLSKRFENGKRYDGRQPKRLQKK